MISHLTLSGGNKKVSLVDQFYKLGFKKSVKNI
jgi:hypothetical protein